MSEQSEATTTTETDASALPLTISVDILHSVGLAGAMALGLVTPEAILGAVLRRDKDLGVAPEARK